MNRWSSSLLNLSFNKDHTFTCREKERLLRECLSSTVELELSMYLMKLSSTQLELECS